MMVNSGLTTVIEPATAAVCGARAGTMHNKSSEHMALAFWLAARGLLGSILFYFSSTPLGVRSGLSWQGWSLGRSGSTSKKGEIPCHAPYRVHGSPVLWPASLMSA